MVNRASERGAALVAALLLMTLLGAMAASLGALAAGELRVSATHRHALAARYAAEAAVAAAVEEIGRTLDWDALLAGLVLSAYVDGAPLGARETSSGTIDLTAVTAAARAGAVATPWQLFLYGPLRELLGADSDAYVIVWVGDDALECDGRPDMDGGPCAAGENAGQNLLALRGAAFGRADAFQEVEVTVGREGPGGRVRIVSWRVVR